MDPNQFEEPINTEVKGSWTPTIILIAIFVLRWIFSSQSNTAIGLRRFLQMKNTTWCLDDSYNVVPLKTTRLMSTVLAKTRKLQLKKQFGFRDDSKYKMGAGDGANLKHKRQG